MAHEESVGSSHRLCSFSFFFGCCFALCLARRSSVVQFVHTSDCADALITLMEHYDQADFISDIAGAESVARTDEGEPAMQRAGQSKRTSSPATTIAAAHTGCVFFSLLFSVGRACAMSPIPSPATSMSVSYAP